MKVYIGIATYNRVEKLKRLLASLEKQTYKDFATVILYDKEDTNTANFLNTSKSKYTENRICFENKAFVIEKWNTFHQKYLGDAHITLVDDVELHTTCIENAVNCLERNFPDLDGVVGIYQLCPFSHDYKFQPTGQILVGTKFLDRYPQKQICCPRYTQWYQDTELHAFAKGLNKFVLCNDAKLIHYHPAFVKNEMDTTHTLSRNELYMKDTKIYNNRKITGKIWGQSFE